MSTRGPESWTRASNRSESGPNDQNQLAQILVKPELINSLSSANPRWKVPVNDETRNSAVLIVAAIAARDLIDWDGKRSPGLVAGVANAVEKAKFLVLLLEEKG